MAGRFDLVSSESFFKAERERLDNEAKKQLSDEERKTLDDQRKQLDDAEKAFEAEGKNRGGAHGHVFRNADWEVHLWFVGDKEISPASYIRNVNVAGRTLELGSAHSQGVGLRLRPPRGEPRVIHLSGEQLPFGGEKDFKELRTTKDNKPESYQVDFDPAKGFELEAVYDASNSPVVRVDEIRLAKTSHRNAERPLLADPLDKDTKKPKRYGDNDWGVAADAGATTGPGGKLGGAAAGGGTPFPTPGGGTGAPPGGYAGSVSPQPGSGAMSGPGGDSRAGGQGGAAAPAADPVVTGNELFARNRYLFVTDECRHLPVAMSVVMDQEHLHEFLAALVNSRLRIQTTQVQIRRAHGAAGGSGPVTPPGGASYGQPGGSSPPPGVGVPPGGGDSRTGAPPTGPGGSAGFTPPTGGKFGGLTPPGGGASTGPGDLGSPTPSAAAADDNPNLIEVSVYGIASLYERPDDPNKKAKEADNPAGGPNAPKTTPPPAK
jgi:hypothetical protein